VSLFKTSQKRIAWQPEAKEALKRVPLPVRALARSRIEKRVSSQGRGLVTLADYEKAERRFKSVMGDKSSDELVALMPADNKPGVEMVVVNACRSQLSGCPNVLIDTDPWQAAVQEVIRQGGYSERMRARVYDPRVLFHHKLKVSISGCPNGCSRPQIADIGLVGFVRPGLDEDCCLPCGLCAKVCPDQAISLDTGLPRFDRGACQGCTKCFNACETQCISLSHPGVRVLLGGRLGRHPHLGRVVCELASPEGLKPLLREWLEQYLEESEAGMRFSIWWQGRQSRP
jgi:anaerobic sulfite reductase subunit C